eukprot:47140-Hanusia_phi.AAC.1
MIDCRTFSLIVLGGVMGAIRSLTCPLPLITWQTCKRRASRLPAAHDRALSSRRCATRLGYTASWT